MEDFEEFEGLVVRIAAAKAIAEITEIADRIEEPELRQIATAASKVILLEISKIAKTATLHSVSGGKVQ